MSKQAAIDLVNKFRARRGTGAFRHFTRGTIADGLRDRIDFPHRINQASSSLCGPASLLYHVASSNPLKYANFGIDLYEHGRASLGKLAVKPGSDCRSYNPPPSIAPVDWMMLASIRDSENWFLDYQSRSDKAAGITMPGALVDWFKKAGYTRVVDRTNVYLTKDWGNASLANRYHQAGYRVCMFIHTNMLYGKTLAQDSWTPNHWVVLTQPIMISRERVWFYIYTWGQRYRRVPPTTHALTKEQFLENYYGFVACKA